MSHYNKYIQRLKDRFNMPNGLVMANGDEPVKAKAQTLQDRIDEKEKQDEARFTHEARGATCYKNRLIGLKFDVRF